MVAIPQIARERLQGTSQIGTPGVDPSTQEIGQSIGAGATEVASAGFDVAMKLQSERNAGEFASLMLDHSKNIMNAAEQIKKIDADNPDKMAGDLSDAMAKSLAYEKTRASNPFVAERVAQGDPSAQMFAMRQISEDAVQQGWRNTLKHAMDTANDYGNKAMAIGGNPSLSPEDMIAATAPLTHGADLLKTSIQNSLHTEQAEDIYNATMKNIYKGVIDPTLTNQPWKTASLLNNPQVAKFFTPDEMEKYQKNADDAVANWPAKIKTQQIQEQLAQHPDTVNGVLNGKLDYAAIDSRQRMDPDPARASFYNYLKDISLKVTSAGGATNAIEKADTYNGFIDSANKLGLKLPGQFATKSAEKGIVRPTIDPNIEHLFKFRDDMVSAWARGVISPAEFSTLNKQLLEPLTAATLKNHDPGWFAEQLNKSKMGSDGSIQKQGWLATTDPSKVDDFRGPYNTIERALTLGGQNKDPGQYATAKMEAYGRYFKALEAVQPGQLNALGRPYSPVDVAHAVMGEALGSQIKVGNSYLTVSGYDPKDGMPIMDTDKEWQESLANAKNLKALKGP